MSRIVCSWCKAPLVLKDDILVCGNIDCPACDEKFLHEELIHTKELLEIEDAEHSMCHTQMLKTTEKLERTRKALDVAVDAIKNATEYLGNQEPLVDVMAMNLHTDLSKALEQITALEQKDVK